MGKPSSRFTEEEQADFIAWYFSDQTSYLLKPLMMDGAFLSICDRLLVLKLAGQQPGREMAVIVLPYYPNSGSEEAGKLAWVNDLTRHSRNQEQNPNTDDFQSAIKPA